MPNTRHEGDLWIWTPQMEEWFTHEFMAEGEERRAEQMLARLLPDLPADIHVVDAMPLLSGDLLV